VSARVHLVALLWAGLGGCSQEAAAPVDMAPPLAPATSKIAHLVVVVQENHSFDNYFGHWCTAPPGSNPTCNAGPGCCEAGPATDPGGNGGPMVLDDGENASYSPDHHQACELAEIDGGRMDRYLAGAGCSSPHNFAYAAPSLIAPYLELAQRYALADRYFQPIAGQSVSNDMYLARARYVFTDNAYEPSSIGHECDIYQSPDTTFPGPTIGDLLTDGGVSWAFYAEGYQTMRQARAAKRCPAVPPDCPGGVPFYPCTYDPSDVPFEFYARFRDDPKYMRDYQQLAADLDGTLPQVSWVKALGFRTEHPAAGTTISDGVAFVTALVDQILHSRYATDTLIVLTYDESGGYFDHVTPPPPSAVDQQPYGPRVPTLALGPFARAGFVSHVQMEHSSIIKFIEWNWLGGATGQLSTRDAVVNNLGSLLDPAATGTAVPEQ
jgi:phospholipase C